MNALHPRTICVIHTGALGDFLLALPALMCLRARFPAASTHLAGNPAWLALALESLAVDRTFSVERIRLYEGFLDSFAHDHRLYRFLDGYDWILSWFGDREGRWERTLHRAFPGRVLVAPFHRHASFPAHVSDFYSQTLPASEVDGMGDLDLRPPWPQELCWVPRPHTSSPGDPGLCIHPGSGSRIKNWPPEAFRTVARTVLERWKMPVCILLGPAERNEQAFWNSAARTGLTLHRDLPLPEVARILSRRALYLGNDSGITHLAASLGVPTLAIYGPTDPARWGPRGPRVRVLQDSRPETRDSPGGASVRLSGSSSDRPPSLKPHVVLESLSELGRTAAARWHNESRRAGKRPQSSMIL